jgi:toxin secretion/phage lysis holin
MIAQRIDRGPMQPHFSFPAALKWLLALITAQWIHHVPWIMQALIMLMVLDYSTGLISAFINRRMSSRIGGRGLFQKGLIIVLLVSADLFEKALGVELHLAAFGGLAYCANEFISIIENCANAGVPIPKRLVRALLSAKNLRFEPASQQDLDDLRHSHVERSQAERGQDSGEANIK